MQTQCSARDWEILYRQAIPKSSSYSLILCSFYTNGQNYYQEVAGLQQSNIYCVVLAEGRLT